MRWIALALLLANLIYGGWLWLQPPSAAAVTTAPAPAGERLILVSEGGAASAGAVQPEGAGEPSAELMPVEVPAPPIPVCEMLGPLPGAETARRLRDRLMAEGADAGAYRLAVATRTDYWVHVGPLPTRREALELLRELQQRQIDSFIIADGELANSISLGYFTREASAARAMAERRAQGYDAKVRGIPRYADQFWVVVENDAPFDAVELPAGTARQKNFCDAIASAEKFE
jgi:hypothetical protein